MRRAPQDFYSLPWCFPHKAASCLLHTHTHAQVSEKEEEAFRARDGFCSCMLELFMAVRAPGVWIHMPAGLVVGPRIRRRT